MTKAQDALARARTAYDAAVAAWNWVAAYEAEDPEGEDYAGLTFDLEDAFDRYGDAEVVKEAATGFPADMVDAYVWLDREVRNKGRAVDRARQALEDEAIANLPTFNVHTTEAVWKVKAHDEAEAARLLIEHKGVAESDILLTEPGAAA